jgi:hypothetical protein
MYDEDDYFLSTKKQVLFLCRSIGAVPRLVQAYQWAPVHEQVLVNTHVELANTLDEGGT